MGQKDITEKVLEDYNDVFADIINGLLFDGVQEIKPEALENTTVHAQYKAEDGKVHELERDIAKYWYTGIYAGKVLMRKKPGDLRSCRKM